MARKGLMPKEHKQDNDRDRYAEQPEKNSGHFSFLRVLFIDSAIENLLRVAQQARLSRQRPGAPITVFCGSNTARYPCCNAA